MKAFHSLGLMSGSSLDGLDICYSIIYSDRIHYSYEIIKAETLAYPTTLYHELKAASALSVDMLNDLDIKLGVYFGQLCNDFIQRHSIKQLDFISSHGHTVYHFPERGITKQIGCPKELANLTSLPVLGNLRQKDIDLGGQGAPIVPIGDLLLFSEYSHCLNLGGIMNVSVKNNDSIISYDIGVCNQILNHYATKLGYSYDPNGTLAKKGKLISSLFDELMNLEYYQKKFPKSLDNSFSNHILEIINSYSNISEYDILHTYTHHIAWLIHHHIDRSSSILISGGGAHNEFILSLLKEKYKFLYTPTNQELVDYKEALVMSLLGVRYKENLYNVLASATGATSNSICGELFKPKLVEK